jgi:hypothetical protein
VSLELLTHLQREHAFDPTPVRDDLGIYHVPFTELVGDTHPERTLHEACLRHERVALVGESGTGKSSLTASVLGPIAEGVAPIIVPVAREAFEVVREPRTMFAHLAGVIAAYAEEASLLDDVARDAALSRATAQRPIGRAAGRSARVTLGWMGAQLGAELSRQAAPSRSIERSATETLETVHQMIEIIRAESLVPVLVLDDTDRWLTGSAYKEPETLVGAFFGRVLPELAELRCALVVAVHRRYLTDPMTQAAVRRTLDTPIEIPSLTAAGAIGRVIESRVRAHASESGVTPPIYDVLTEAAVDRLFQHYQRGLRGELRGVLGAIHIALAEACDGRAQVIGPELIDDALTVWEPEARPKDPLDPT